MIGKADGALPETADALTIEQAELRLEQAATEVAERVDPSVVDVDAIRTRALSDAENMRRFFELSREEQMRELARMAAVNAALAVTNVHLNQAIDGLQGRVTALEERVNTYIEDEVTGLPVRRYFIREAFPQAVDFLRRINTQPRWLTLVLIDFDNFKKANTELGYLGADVILRSGADILKNEAFKRTHTDKLVRFGGDEFAAAIPTTPNADVERICREIILARMRERTFGEDGGYKQTLSISLVSIQVTKDLRVPPLDLLKGMTQLNNEALDVCKAGGKDQVRNVGLITIDEVVESAGRVKEFKENIEPDDSEAA